LVFTTLAALAALVAVASAAALAPSAEAVQPLAVGEAAPAFTLPDAAGKSFDLAAAFAARPTVLVFYRGGWCPFCNRHLAALAEIEPELRRLGYQIIGISPDAPEALHATGESHNLRYQLLSDAAMQASPAYRIAYRIPPDLAEKYRGYGVTLPRTPDGSEPWLPVPAAFIVGRDGRVKFAYANADYQVRISNEDLLAAARAAAR
jgi:peroxiredoxin